LETDDSWRTQSSHHSDLDSEPCANCSGKRSIHHDRLPEMVRRTSEPL